MIIFLADGRLVTKNTCEHSPLSIDVEQVGKRAKA